MDEILANAYIKGASDLLQGKIEGMPKIVVIPDNATNGDVFMTMFPDAMKSNYIESGLEMKDYVTIYLGDYEMRVSYDWWNAKYKKEVEGESK